MADAPKKGGKGKTEEKPEVYNKRSLYKVEGTKVIRSKRHCPKDGPGVFLAEHKDRFSCGKCGYTEFKKRENPPGQKTA